MNQINENENKGFSLVELIVVIAIMAVLTSVLAPSLLGYVEKSRMQKDDSAMGEVTNAIKLALADQNVYDECLKYSIKENHSCYVDKGTYTVADMALDKCNSTTGATPHDHNAESNPTAANAGDDLWHYKDNTRMRDEEAYGPAGKMRGMTITFKSAGGSNVAEFKLTEGAVNLISGAGADSAPSKATTGTQLGTAATLGTMQSTNGQPGQLYNKLRAVIGDSITLSSQTYRNSEYTVFIRMGSQGGNQASAQDAIAVYGQWNGTNLTK